MKIAYTAPHAASAKHYALLLGSILLFCSLAAVMVMIRTVDPYGMDVKNK